MSFHRVTIGKSIDQSSRRKTKEIFHFMDHQVVKATELHKAEVLHTEFSLLHSIWSFTQSHIKNIFSYDCTLCLIAFVDIVCKDKSNPTCISLVWKVRRWAHAYVPLNPQCTLSSTDLNRTFGLRQDAAKTSRNFDDQILTFKNECPSTFNRTSIWREIYREQRDG